MSKLRSIERRPPRGTPEVGSLVLLHAFPLNAHMWEPQLALAEAGWHVVAPHYPGMAALGEAAEPPVDSLEVAAGQVEALLDAHGIERAVIGGLSMGGYLALATYRRAPTRFLGLILADTRAEADTPEARQGRLAMLETLRTGGVSAVVEAMLPRLISQDTRETRPALPGRLRDLACASSTEAVGACVHALMTRHDSTALLPTIGCPTLVLVGQHDAITPPAASESLARGIAGAELVVVPRAGHLSSLERADEFNGALESWLQRLRS